MPLYEYKCRECGEVGEFIVHGLPDSKTLACHRCGSQNLDRLLSVPNLIKGKGTDAGTTCCGKTERCETPPCSANDRCRRT